MHDDFRPDRDKTSVYIPLTLDIKRDVELPLTQKLLFTGLGILGSIVVSILFLFTIPSKKTAFIISFVLIFVVQLGLRYILVKEPMYKKSMRDLQKIKNNVPYVEYVNILTVEDMYPHLVRFANGSFGYYIRLEKDTIIGKGEYGEYNHHEGVSEAINHLISRGLKFKRVDYMDNNSGDARLDLLKKQYENTPPTLKRYMHAKYNYLEQQMKLDTQNHDVLFVYTEDQNVDSFGLLKTLKEVGDLLLQANYVRVIVLNEQEVEQLAQVVLNSKDINFIDVKSQISRNKKSNILRKIATKDYEGNITKHAKTREEMEQERRISANEKRARRGSFFRKNKDNDNIDW